MQAKLTSRLIGAFLLTVLGLAQAAEPQLDDQAQVSYLQGLKRQYGQSSERQALFAHCNDLLKRYALTASYQVGQAQRRDLTYSLAQGRAGELLVREEQRTPGQLDLAVHNQRVELFGLDPFVRYECPAQGIRCELLAPQSSQSMLTIRRDLKGAAELAKALSFLIRNLQKG